MMGTPPLMTVVTRPARLSWILNVWASPASVNRLRRSGFTLIAHSLHHTLVTGARGWDSSLSRSLVSLDAGLIAQGSGRPEGKIMVASLKINHLALTEGRVSPEILGLAFFNRGGIHR